MDTSDTLVLSIFMALEGVHAYSAFLPSVFTIRTFVDTDLGRAMIREGELFASAFLLLLSATVAVIAKSPLPLLLGLGAGAGMVWVYERALYQATYGASEGASV